MPTQDLPAAEQFWLAKAKRLATKLNFHHWLAQIIPLLFFLLVQVALFDLFRRETGLPARCSEGLLLFGSGIAGGWAWLKARKHFCTDREALVRLETVHRLHNRLSTARDGILPWPEPRGILDDGYAANWKQIVLPLLAGLLFLWSSHLVPVSPTKSAAYAEPISEPPEFAQVQSWINTLKSEDLIEPDKLQEMQANLDKLRNRPPEDWYTQNNLEAADSLKELMEQSMNSLAQDLDQADQTVEAMKEKMESSSDASSLQPMQDELREAGENLTTGSLPLKHELVSQLKEAEATDKALSASQLQALHDRLKKGALAARTAPRSNGGLSSEMQQAMMAAAMGQGPMRREGRLVAGSGGTGGGEKSAPLELQPRDKTTPQGPLTSMSTDDMSHISLGDTVKVSAGDQVVDPSTYQGLQQAGAAQVAGAGGEAVWRSTYDPQEADTLSRFFK